jgi:hypothetical protein
MKLFKWAYGALSIISTIALIASLFIPDINPLIQITLVLQSVGFGWICGVSVGGEL